MNTTRRDLLIGGVRLAALAQLSSLGFAQRPNEHGESGERKERVLVVVQLTGGNDGLNTVIPFRQDDYFRMRPGLAQPPRELHRIDDDHGLHPALAELGALFERGRLAVVHGAGLPQPDRSHFRSMDVWHTAELAPRTHSLGWLGRLADRIVDARPGTLAALHVGDGAPPRALAGERFQSPSLADESSLRLAEPGDARRAFARARAELLDGAAGSRDLELLRGVARGTYAAARRIEELAAAPGRADYPDTALARQMRLVARLIDGGVGTRIVQLELGGFDTHARQARTHAALLAELSGALGAFQADLEASGIADRVVTLVFSEFGRRARENGSGGTDHGAGAPVFVAGAKVRGGVYGTPPDLARLVDGDVPVTTDFRSIYAGLERGWMEMPPSASDVEPLDLV